MTDHDWIHEFPAAITVCDRAGIIIAMNAAAGRTFARSGGTDLVGKSLYSCHPEKANVTIRALMDENRSNTYTIEKGGVKKLIHQSPWYRDGNVAGLVEMSLVLPAEMPHFVRQP